MSKNNTTQGSKLAAKIREASQANTTSKTDYALIAKQKIEDYLEEHNGEKDVSNIMYMFARLFKWGQHADTEASNYAYFLEHVMKLLFIPQVMEKFMALYNIGIDATEVFDRLKAMIDFFNEMERPHMLAEYHLFHLNSHKKTYDYDRLRCIIDLYEKLKADAEQENAYCRKVEAYD